MPKSKIKNVNKRKREAQKEKETFDECEKLVQLIAQELLKNGFDKNPLMDVEKPVTLLKG